MMLAGHVGLLGSACRRGRHGWRSIVAAVALLLVLLPAPAARAVEPDEILSDPKLESRARKLSAELRCLVCQNQSIDDSNAPLARDLRLLVRERLKAGDDDKAVMDFIVARYGEFVLLKPTFGLNTVILWLAPLALLIGGVVMVHRGFARSSREATAATSLTPEENAAVEKLLREK
jgi:cytochrome c-type biogenesis protein CcmH